jgi:hypothetical protein
LYHDIRKFISACNIKEAVNAEELMRDCTILLQINPVCVLMKPKRARDGVGYSNVNKRAAEIA